MVRKRTFDRWAEQARSSLVASFANGILKDQAAVITAITRLWPNGQTRKEHVKCLTFRWTAVARSICSRRVCDWYRVAGRQRAARHDVSVVGSVR